MTPSLTSLFNPIAVKMTITPLLQVMIPLVADLSCELSDQERYGRLLAALRQLVPCDAVALLRLDGEQLTPLAVEGLSPDTLGRRFRVADHPRLEALLSHTRPTRFSSDCNLPDPYDGLIHSVKGQLEVHDCMGCPLYLDDQLWGLLTLDALDPARFDRVDLEMLATFGSLAAATVKASEGIHRLARRIEDERHLAEVYRQVARQRSRELIGNSPPLRQLLDEIRLVGESALTVLITGETGVGKELVAEAIHNASPRGHQPFVSLNCAALPDALVESELFGHVRGAFSGAIKERKGKFELADGGTLFLDEIGELPLSIQAKLLRVLQSGQLQRLGSDHEHRVDVRIIAATNRILADEVRAGRFRADLYHRLSVYPLPVPPLRERGKDVLLLAGFFLEENRAHLGLRSLRLTPEAQKTLLAYPWPGNVRELEHLIGRAALKALARQPERPRILSIDEQALDLSLAHTSAIPQHSNPMLNPADELPSNGLRQAVDDFQRRLIQNTLAQHDQCWNRTAKALQIDRANLNRLARRLGLKG